jgi:hypothetical protein
MKDSYMIVGFKTYSLKKIGSINVTNKLRREYIKTDYTKSLNVVTFQKFYLPKRLLNENSCFISLLLEFGLKKITFSGFYYIDI